MIDWATHQTWIRLLTQRGGFRFQRVIHRIRSPRRIVATVLTLLFFGLYLVNGVFILSTRTPADPERLRLWLSGGMVIYAVYHSVRCAWSRQTSDLELTAAESLWLGGAPVRRSTVALYRVGGLVFSTALKTALLAVVLAVDVAHIELLCVGVFTSLLLLEISRLTIARWSAAISDRTRRAMRIAATAVASAIVIQIVARIAAATPPGSATIVYVLNAFAALGQTAASPMIQWLSLPWIASAKLVITESFSLTSIAQLVIAIATLPISMLAFVRIDHRAEFRSHMTEQSRLRRGEYHRDETAEVVRESTSIFRSTWILRYMDADLASLLVRQWNTVQRYAGTIAFSFFVPTVLCLSPLATGRITDQWFFVVGGIALCTVLLAPPALRIDFRRDLRRMLLLRSLPVRPMSMVLGQLLIPVMITCTFQCFTIAVAAAFTLPGWSSVVMWTGMLTALSLFTFATENALFLAFPHHEHTEGVAMMVRAKLTFIGKAAVLLASLMMLAAWAGFCANHLPPSIARFTLVVGAIVATWVLAIAALVTASWCWRRFDVALDVPPA
ncbi:hypothetical protein Poly51_48230 [Rubripirellula tenax]|uniref:Uncharacterized protein n=1 Tax=Rubripirellula tenax TaxID=2528015 RepID=A0A5C6ENJ3_9BACT|nr:hypothetical protein [Rubripirellula tenax]TWU48919.1 hypothetical protein Poly51_48230 [Rubripirellula tenax]